MNNESIHSRRKYYKRIKKIKVKLGSHSWYKPINSERFRFPVYYGYNKNYYIFTEPYDYSFMSKAVLGIEIEIENFIATFILDNFYIMKFDENFNIDEKICISELSDEQYREVNGPDIISILDNPFTFVTYDCSSEEGRNILLENFIEGYDHKIHNLPEWMKLKTKKAEANFIRYTKKVSHELVPVEKIVGTMNCKYEGSSWYDWFLHVKHCSYTMWALKNPEYYETELNTSDLSFYKIEDEYYHTEGNNRAPHIQLLGVKEVKARVSHFYIDRECIDYLNKYRALGFEVQYEPETCLDVSERNSWEKWKLILDGEFITCLNGMDEIKKFYNYFIELDLGIKKRIKHYFFKKYYEYTENNYFNHRNEILLTEHKRLLTNKGILFFAENKQ